MKPTLFLALIAVMFTACATPYVARLDPQMETETYRNGEKLVTQSDGRAQVTVSYYDSSPKYVVFHMGVDNLGDTPFNFDPATCLLVGDAGPVRQAIDPEVQLLATDLETVKELRSDQFLALTGTFLNVASAALATTNGVQAADALFYGEVAVNTALDLSFALQDGQVEDEVVRGALVPLGGTEPAPDSRYFWLDYAFRITTIGPGKSAFGKIAFERNDEAENLVFKVTVEGEEFSFPFSQKLFKPGAQ